MAALQNTNAYVKFVRGTRAAWDILKSQNEIYDDTLYFIYETKGSSTGVLYLGTTQIGGTDGEQPIPTNLADLGDVEFLNQKANDILVYNGNNQWINSSIEKLINLDTNIFELDVDNLDEISIKGFKAAAAGTIPQKNENGTISWVLPEEMVEITEIKDQISDIQEEIKDFISEEEAKTLITEEVAKIDHLTYEKVEDLDEALSKLEPNKIYLVPTGDIENQYDEYMVLDGVLEPVGSWSVDLDNYVTVETLNSKVGELNESINSLAREMSAVDGAIDELNKDFNDFKTQIGDLDTLNTYTENATLVQQVNHLTEQLQWQEIVE